MFKRASAVFAAAMLALTGCSGEDGDPGKAGQDGTSCTVAANGDGTSTVTCEDGTVATISDGTDGTNGQSCLLTTNADGTRTLACPGASVIILPAPAISGNVEVTDQVAAIDGADVVVTFKVKLNGAASSAFTTKVAGSSSAYRHTYNATTGEGTRTGIADTAYTVTADAAGSYTARFPGLATTIGTTPTTFLMKLNTGVAEPQATVVAYSPVGAPKSTVSDQACKNCHGNNVFAKDGLHKGVNPQGVGACVVCHVTTTASRGQKGDRLKAYVHGIHNSHAMSARDITVASIDPDGYGPLAPVTGPFTVTKAADVYARNDSLNFVPGSYPDAPVAQIASPFSIGFPSYMNNCSTCHDTQANLDSVLSKPVTYSTCMSCHDGWDGFKAEPAGHATFDATTSCASCHGGGVAATSKVGDFHGKRQAYTPRYGLLYDGKDQSIEYGKRMSMKIDEITRDDSDPAAKKLVVKWSATLDGAAVNPCNTDFAVGPVFMGATADGSPVYSSPSGRQASNMNLLQAYAVGNDWVSEGIGTSPGQPLSENVTLSNTTCASNVATTKIAAATTTATKGVLGLQGKPQLTFTGTTATGTPYTRIIQARSPSPTREFVTATGAEPTDKRRAIADSSKCLSCHQGSLYQHGGNRVDSVDLCVICHNPAANEKNVRAGLGVTASEAYDGKPGQTYDFRYMLHAIHSAGETNAPLVYYRGMGIYAFGSEAAIAALPNWPGSGSQPIFGADVATNRTHNEIVVHYPRALNDCGACHTSNAVALPSTTKAVAVTTYDAGAAPWGVQTDDVLMSPATASCMSCHQSGDVATQAALRAHAFQNSWTPAVFTGGRADILGGGASESCLVCHGAGKAYDYAAKHGN